MNYLTEAYINSYPSRREEALRKREIADLIASGKASLDDDGRLQYTRPLDPFARLPRKIAEHIEETIRLLVEKLREEGASDRTILEERVALESELRRKAVEKEYGK